MNTDNKMNIDNKMNTDNKYIFIACFDIGKKNFAFNVDRVDISRLSNIENVPSNKRYMKNGTPTSEFYKMMTDVCNSIKTIQIENLDLTDGCDKKQYLRSTNVCKYVQYS